MSVQEQIRPVMADVIAGLIGDAYQAESERFDAEMERVDGDACACRHDLQCAVRTPRIRALVDRFIEAEEAAASIRYRGFSRPGLRRESRSPFWLV